MDQTKIKRFIESYQAAQDHSLLLQHSVPAVLQLEGPDSFDFINRMSTNDMLHLDPGEVHSTIFTNAHARIIDIATVIPEGNSCLLLCWQDTAIPLQAWLSRYIFFQDDVRINVSMHPWQLYDLIGPEAGDRITRYASIEQYNGDGLHVMQDGYVWSYPLGNLARYRILVRAPLVAKIFQHEQRVSDPLEASTLYEVLRIEAGVPRMGFEILEDSIPLEVGLKDNISFSKGCYIGQEIIARMESRAKLAHTLVGLRLNQETQTGAALIQEGRSIGQVTSIAHSPRLGWIGLGLVKPDSLNHPAKALVAGSSAYAQLQSLPLS